MKQEQKKEYDLASAGIYMYAAPVSLVLLIVH